MNGCGWLGHHPRRSWTCNDYAARIVGVQPGDDGVGERLAVTEQRRIDSGGREAGVG